MSGLVSKWRLGQSWDGWLHSSVVLNEDVCCKFPFVLALGLGLMHPYVFFFKNNYKFIAIDTPEQLPYQFQPLHTSLVTLVSYNSTVAN